MLNQIYNLVIICYRFLVYLVSFRNPKAKKMVVGHRHIFDYLRQNVIPGQQYVWFHASSLGEFEQGRPLVEALKAKYPEKKILVTFFSPSGYEVRKNYATADLICYLPFDTLANVRRFLDLVNPEKVIFIKYEFWANYLNELRRREIPTYIVSAIFRPSQIFFRPYGGYFRKVLRAFDRLYVQDDASKKMLVDIGVTRVEVVGDTRFDRVLEIKNQAKDLPLVAQFRDQATVLIAGSSWPADEDIFIPYFNAHPELKLIIAPHEVHEGHLASIKAKLKRPYVMYTQANEQNLKEADCLIIDCFGLLSSIYRCGDMAFIGGGFGAGIHNVPEAAVYGIPTMFGPRFGKFREARQLSALGGGFVIREASDFNQLMDSFLSDKPYMQSAGEISGKYILDNIGASEKIFKELFA